MVRIELTFRNLLLLLVLLVFAWVTYIVRDTVVLLGISLMVMATLHPLVKLAERRGLSHSIAIAVVMLSLVLVPVLIIAALTPLIIGEVQGFANSFPTLQQHINELLRNWGVATRVNEAIDKANLSSRISSIALVSATQTVTIVAEVFTVIVIAGYLLADSRRLQLVLHEFVPRSSERHIEPLLGGMERVVGGYIRGQILTSAMFGTFATVFCLALRVPNPLVLGLVAAIGDVIPLFGVPIAMVIAVIVAFTSSIWQPIAVIVGYTVYLQLESHLLVPRIYARTVNLSPLMVIVATIVGGALDGVRGILIGIPIVGVLKVVFDYVVAQRVKGHETGKEVMLEEPTDAIGRLETVETQGLDPASVGAEPAETGEGIPEPTYSPFEPVPEPDEAPTVSGARFATLANKHARRQHAAVQRSSALRKRHFTPPQVVLKPPIEPEDTINPSRHTA